MTFRSILGMFLVALPFAIITGAMIYVMGCISSGFGTALLVWGFSIIVVGSWLLLQ